MATSTAVSWQTYQRNKLKQLQQEGESATILRNYIAGVPTSGRKIYDDENTNDGEIDESDPESSSDQAERSETSTTAVIDYEDTDMSDFLSDDGEYEGTLEKHFPKQTRTEILARNASHVMLYCDGKSWELDRKLIGEKASFFGDCLKQHPMAPSIEVFCPGGAYLGKRNRVPLELRSYHNLQIFVDYLKYPNWAPKLRHRRHNAPEFLVSLYFMGAELDANEFVIIVWECLIPFLERHALSAEQICDILDTIGAYELSDEEEEDEGAGTEDVLDMSTYNDDFAEGSGFDFCGDPDDMSDAEDVDTEMIDDTSSRADISELRDVFLDIAARNRSQLEGRRCFSRLLKRFPDFLELMETNEPFEGEWPCLVEDA